MERVRRNSSKLENVNHSFEDAEKQLVVEVRDVLGAKYAKTNRILVLMLENELMYHARVVERFQKLTGQLEDMKQSSRYIEHVDIHAVAAPAAAAATTKIQKQKSKSQTQYPVLHGLGGGAQRGASSVAMKAPLPSPPPMMEPYASPQADGNSSGTTDDTSAAYGLTKPPPSPPRVRSPSLVEEPEVHYIQVYQ
eukprot:Filipodium_phascolosomae@DN5751_c0_g2_i1.p1